MPYNLAEAGKAIGMSKSSVLRAIRRGTISAARDAATGGWVIDPAELHRVFPPVAASSAQPANDTGRNSHETGETAEIRELRARLADAQEQISDLRRRLDRADEQRQQAQTQLAALLADQRPRTRWQHFLRRRGAA
jgi:hypothetical protein